MKTKTAAPHARVVPVRRASIVARRAATIETGRALPASRAQIQPKLRVGAVDDPMEREADAMAQRVISMPTPEIVAAEATPNGGRGDAGGTGDSGGGDAVQPSRNRTAAAVGPQGGAAPSDVAAFVDRPGAGRPLSAALRAFMQPRFGADFTNVRVHDAAADRTAASRIGARAFTLRHHIWLGPGETAEDGRLMAHELTHVTQQTRTERPAAAAERSQAARVPLVRDDGASNPGAEATRSATRAMFGAFGRPLDSASSAVTESYFGQDFGEAQVHNEARAAENAGARPIAPAEHASTPPLMQRKCAECEAVDERNGSSEFVLHRAQHATGVQRLCAGCEERLQRKAQGAACFGGEPATPVMETAVNALGSGMPLPASERAFFEPRFGRSFDGVRIHTGTNANMAAHAANARAFTLGNNIAFASGEFRTDTSEGRRLLAHELTHTVQQPGDASNTIQRSLKFEFQTTNYVWMVGDKTEGQTAAQYNPSAELLDRKYGPDGKPEEHGDMPAYLSTGPHGGPARPAGNVFVEVQRDLTMKPANKGVDAGKPAQFMKIFVFTTKGVTEDLVEGKTVAERPLKLYSQIDNATNPGMEGKYNPNTFEYRYYNDEPTQLNVHLDENGVFQKDEDPSISARAWLLFSNPFAYLNERPFATIMKVGRKDETDADPKNAPQFIETWRINNAAKTEDYLGTMAEVELVRVADNAKKPGQTNKYRPNSYEKSYYLASDFAGNELKKNAKRQDVHLDKDGTLQKGHVKLMEMQKLPKSEQTAIELQSEHGGFIEFETPKWFRNWSELKMRIEDAVAMTKAIDGARELKDTSPLDRKILQSMRKKKKKNQGKVENLGKVVEWPAAFSTRHLTKLHKNNRKLVAEIIDPKWTAKIQVSEGISLSQYRNLQEEHVGKYRADRNYKYAANIFMKAKSKSKYSALSETLFANLLGFLQLLVTYIIRGQTLEMYSKNSIKATYSKAAFWLMARTNFSSMYKDLLSADEQALFAIIVKDSSDPIFAQLRDPICELRTSERARRKKEKEALENDPKKSAQLLENPRYWDLDRWKCIPLTRESTFFFDKVGTESDAATYGPKIHAWLSGMTDVKGKDALSGPGFSLAMGAKTAQNQPGDKDYKLALFEIRETIAHGGNTQPRANWVSFAEAMFKSAAKRAADTPDDPTTPGINEASKTGLKE